MIVCADDYGLADDVDRSILELAGAGRLSAVSCMVVLERCTPERLAQLLAHPSTLDIGLHLCFTFESVPLSKSSAMAAELGTLPSFGALFRRSLARALPLALIRKELTAQYELFLARCGRKPDFIDGHLYVHQLPGIREEVVRFVQSLPAGGRPYVRNASLPLVQLRRRGLPWLKALLIGAFGTRMKQLLLASGLETNDGFAGIYAFKRWRSYPEYFPRFVDCLEKPNGMLVVHPGAREEWRRQEFNTLRQFAFAPAEPRRFSRKPAGAR